MRPIVDFIVKPVGGRYSNSVNVGDKSLILNTGVFNHSYINCRALVVTVPTYNPTGILEGDELVIHHNVFRRWHDMHGLERNSRGFLNDGEFLVGLDQVFMYGQPSNWTVMPGFTFLKPIHSTDLFFEDTEAPLIGVVKHSDGTFDKEELVGFSPGDEFEFVIDGERLYRVINRFINIKYEYKGNEKEYNPSWAHSC